MYFNFENRKKNIDVIKCKGLSPSPHIHSQIELVFVYSGECICRADDKAVKVCSGDAFISFPNQVHFYNQLTPVVDNTIIIFSPDECPEFGSAFKSSVPASPLLKGILHDADVAYNVEKFPSAFNSSDKYCDITLRGLLLTLMSRLMNTIKLDEKKYYDPNLIKEIITYCYENYSNDICLDDIAENLHINKYYISHVFSKRLGVGFNNYINSLRIQNACSLLRENLLSITEISYSVGYNSPRSFNRCFMKEKGITPKQYRNNIISKEFS